MSTAVEPKAQHYIPNFYLDGFTDTSRVLWVYEKFKPLRASKPKNEAHKPDYYTHVEQGERDENVWSAGGWHEFQGHEFLFR
jgi:hypothetical protein